VRTVGLIGGNFPGSDADRFGRADEFAELAGHAFLAAVGIHDQSGHATITGGDRRALLGILERLLRSDKMLEGRLQPARDLRQVGALEKSERLAFYGDDGHGAGRFEITFG